MKIKNLFTVNNLLVNVKKEECEQLKEFTQKHGIIMKIGNLEEYPSLFPTKISIWFDPKRKIHIAALATPIYKLHENQYTAIDFKNIDFYLKS